MVEEHTEAEAIKNLIRDVPDFPKPGIIFKDITPIIGDPLLFRKSLDMMLWPFGSAHIDKIAGIDARGFIFGGAMADRIGCGFVPVRKKGKLPYKTYEENYDLEYGSSSVAVHQDGIHKGDRVLIVDDLLATGGTAAATTRLVQKCGGEVIGLSFLVELSFLKGREKLKGFKVNAVVVF